MKQSFRWHDYLTINIYYLGLATLSNTMAPFVIPLLVEQFVGEAQKATYYDSSENTLECEPENAGAACRGP